MAETAQAHPIALIHYDTLRNEDAKRSIAHKTEYFVDRLAQALARIAASRHPAPVIVRMSDFKTNEYANLIGGGERGRRSGRRRQSHD